VVFDIRSRDRVDSGAAFGVEYSMSRLAPVVLIALVVAGTVLAGTAATGAAQGDDRLPTIPLGGQAEGTPAAETAGVQLVNLYAFPLNNWVYFRGELLNTTDQTVSVPKVTLTLHDQAGGDLATIPLLRPPSIWSDVPYLIPPGRWIGVEGAKQMQPDTWAGATAEIGEVTPVDQSVLDAQASGLELFNVSERQKTDKMVDILGQVRNTGTQTATGIEVRIVFRLADGRYAAADAHAVYPQTLAPGQTGSFFLYEAPYVDGPGWTYDVTAVGVASAETPPEVDKGIAEFTGKESPAGAPLTERTGVELTNLYVAPGDPSDWATFFGELRNTTDRPVEAPAVSLTLFDADGKVVNSRQSESVLSIIPPGETSPIEISTDIYDGKWARARVMLDAATSADPADIAEGLAIDNLTAQQTDDHLTLSGDFVNNGTKPIKRGSIEILFYDANGRYAGHDSAYSGLFDTVDPGDRASFDYDEDVDLAPGWTYRLVVEGRNAG
jgi:hypothetical protein